eukprot:gene1816-14257_t
MRRPVPPKQAPTLASCCTLCAEQHAEAVEKSLPLNQTCNVFSWNNRNGCWMKYAKSSHPHKSGDISGILNFTNSTVTAAHVLDATATPAATATAAAGPCDIYAKGSTPCVAAHSMTRALYAAYDGPLYHVKNAGGAFKDVGVVAAGGPADSKAHDAFCGSGACVVQKIYDQSPQ